MPRCIWCQLIKPVKAFTLTRRGLLREVCTECEKLPLIYCAFCGNPVHSSALHKIGKRLFECTECHENTLAIKEKNTELKILWKLNQLIRKSKNMSENRIGDLREKLFETIDGLNAGTISPEVAAQITDVAKTIIDSARVENEFVKLTGSAGSGFIPVSGNGQKGPKQLNG